MVAPTIIYLGKSLPRGSSGNETDYLIKTKNESKNYPLRQQLLTPHS